MHRKRLVKPQRTPAGKPLAPLVAFLVVAGGAIVVLAFYAAGLSINW